jgi:hypothetical protein
MSLTLHSTRRNWALPTAAGRADRAPIAPAILRFARKALVKSAKLVMRASETFAEARMQQAMIEAGFYQNIYSHSSKNDDDLPMVMPPPTERPARNASPRAAWRRAACAVIAMAKRVYPIIFVFGIFATLVIATIAIRLAIWHPLNLH